MRIFLTYLVAGLVLFIGRLNSPYFDLYPLHYYIDQPTLVFFILAGIACCALWTRQDFKTLFQLFTAKPLSADAAQMFLINLERSWKIVAYGTFVLGVIGTASVLYNISDMAKLGTCLALSILCPLYLLVLRWWVVGPMMQKLKKVQFTEGAL